MKYKMDSREREVFTAYQEIYWDLRRSGKQQEANELSRQYLASLRRGCEKVTSGRRTIARTRYDRVDVV